MRSRVMKNGDAALRDLGGGVSRKVLAHIENLMVVEVRFETGAQGAPHRHAHAQGTYVKSGAFTFTVEGESFCVREGDTLAFAPNEPHGCVCTEKGVLVDTFSPMREDFL